MGPIGKLRKRTNFEYQIVTSIWINYGIDTKAHDYAETIGKVRNIRNYEHTANSGATTNAGPRKDSPSPRRVSIGKFKPHPDRKRHLHFGSAFAAAIIELENLVLLLLYITMSKLPNFLNSNQKHN